MTPFGLTQVFKGSINPIQIFYLSGLLPSFLKENSRMVDLRNMLLLMEEGEIQ